LDGEKREKKTNSEGKIMHQPSLKRNHSNASEYKGEQWSKGQNKVPGSNEPRGKGSTKLRPRESSPSFATVPAS